MPPPGWKPIQPTGLAATILAVGVIFSALSTIVLSLRIWARYSNRIFALEDWLMCIGFIINMTQNSVVCYGTFTGLGSYDADITGGTTGATYMEGIKSIFLWQVFFLSGFGFIKCSICVTLLRIAVVRWHRIVLWTLIVITTISSIFVTIYVLAQCRPIARSWGEVEGTCLPNTVTVVITLVISALNIITDVTTAILPFLMLRKVQMEKRRKIAITLVLSLGTLASIATIARLPFADAYFAKENYLVGIGHVILFSMLECDLALIAGSLPMLRTFIKGLRSSASGSKSKTPYDQSELVTIGRKGYTRHTDISREEAGDGDGSAIGVGGITVGREFIITHKERSTDSLRP